MEERDVAAEEAIEVIARFEDNELYGGLYLGETLGDPVTVNIVGETKATAALEIEIRSMFRNSDNLRFESVDQSLRDLRAEADLLFESIADRNVPTSVGVDERQNVVVVKLTSATLIEEQHSRRGSESKFDTKLPQSL